MAIIYVDPTNGTDNGDAGRGESAGSSAYASIDYAITNYGSWATTEGNTINLANTSADTLTGSIATSAIATANSQLVIQGYDAGGSLTLTGPYLNTITNAGHIDGNDAVAACFSAPNYVTFKNIKLMNWTGNQSAGTASLYLQCELAEGGGSYTLTGADAFNMIGCYLHTSSSPTYAVYRPASMFRCRVVTGGGSGVFLNGLYQELCQCFISGFSTVGIQSNNDRQFIARNTIDGHNGGSSAVGIKSGGAAADGINIWDNIIANLDGASAVGISAVTGSALGIVGNNAYYNNTTDTDYDTPSCAITDVTESTDPFTDSSTGDYSLVTGANSIGAAMFTNADPANPDNIGAWQDYSSGGGGGGGQTAHVFAG